MKYVRRFLSFSDQSSCANDGKAPKSANFYEMYEECCKLYWMDVNACLANKPAVSETNVGINAPDYAHRG
jgi:hypothetical protein